MNEQLWTVRMLRKVGEIESSFIYKVPAEYSDYLNNWDRIKETYKQSVMMELSSHILDKFESSGFLPQDIKPPGGVV
jgi:hypothetical protein